MKKTLQLSIGGSLFNVEEDAFEKLESYLNSVRKHFVDNSDKEEILKDIEGRVAENFSENADKIITLQDVESVIETMGTVEQFDGSDDNKEVEGNVSKVKKQLYRDTDNATIAGVSSGLGHFFGISPIIIRLIFIASVLLGVGSGIIIYLILWFVIPEAKTSSQKLSMRGDAVTISAMADIIKEKIEEVHVAENKTFIKKAASGVVDVIQSLILFAGKVILPSARIILGLVIILLSFSIIVGTTMFTSAALFSASPTLIDGPLLVVAQSGVAKILILSLSILILIPLIFALILGLNILAKRNYLSKLASSILLGIWFISIAVVPAVGSVVVMRVNQIIENDPYYKSQSKVLETQPFDKVVVSEGQSVKFVKGDKYLIETIGRGQALSKVLILNENGEVKISRKDQDNQGSFIRCDDCDFAGSVEVIITTPTISLLTIKDSSYVSGVIEVEKLAINVNDSSGVDLYVKTSELNLITTDSSRVELSGKTETLIADIQNSSRFIAEGLETSETKLKVVDSSNADIYVTKSLDVIVGNSSFVSYFGQPTVLVKKIDETSTLKNAEFIAENEESDSE